MTNRMTLREATISLNDSELFELIPAWTAAAQSRQLTTGERVDQVMSRARDFCKRMESGDPGDLDIHDRAFAADVLHGVCRVLMDDFGASPEATRTRAGSVWKALALCQWQDDDLEEREELLCSLAFVAWRAARFLGRFQEV